MKTLCSVIAVAVMLNVVAINAQTDTSNVPPQVKQMLRRMGNTKNELGDSNGFTAEDAIQDALKPPKDDSYKWYVTLFVESVSKTDKQLTQPCLALKNDLENDPSADCFINVIDKSKSFTHYNVRNLTTDKDLHSDFISNIADKLTELPAILVQPPRNGKFGKNESTVVLVSIPNYKHGDIENVINTIRQGVRNYIEVKFNNGELPDFPNDGHKQAGAPAVPLTGLEFMREPTGKKSPYKTFPDGAGNPTRLSKVDISDLVPDAPKDFVEYCFDNKLTRDEVLSEWNTELQHRKAEEANAKLAEVTKKVEDTSDKQENFHQEISQTLSISTEIMVLMIFVGVCVQIWNTWKHRQDMVNQRILLAKEHDELTAIVKRFDVSNSDTTKS